MACLGSIVILDRPTGIRSPEAAHEDPKRAARSFKDDGTQGFQP